MFLTRIGFGSPSGGLGDVSQIDLPKGAQRPDRRRAGAQSASKGIAHPLHQRRRGAPPAGGARIVDAYDAPRRALRSAVDYFTINLIAACA